MRYTVEIYDETFTFVVESEKQETALRALIEKMGWKLISTE